MSSRLENNAVCNDLKTREAEWADAGIKSVKLIGDANAPGPIAWATYAVHRYARELDGEDIGEVHRRSGALLCLPTKWRGEMVFRLCIVNPETDAETMLETLKP